MKIIDNRLLKVLDLFNSFVYKKGDFIVGSLDLYIYLRFNGEDLFNKGFFEKRNPSLKLFFSNKNIRFSVDKDLYGIPIFPPVSTPFYKLYEKMIEIYGSVKIDLVILDDSNYKILKKNVEDINSIPLLNFDFYNNKFIEEIDFKINSLEKTSYFGFKDIYRIISKIQLLYKFLYNNSYEYSFILDIFKNLDKQFGRKFLFEPGNIKVNSYTGVARFLFEDFLSISNDIINYFDEKDIILAVNTSVSYMKFIVKSGGIITMNNNKLSHASIISRELNLPLVLGAEHLFLKIFDGDLIEINSKTGEVNILKRFWEK